MLLRKKTALIISAFVLSFFLSFFCGHLARAMPVGTLLYRTSSNGNLYGHNTTELVVVKNKMVKNIYTGHVAMYIGQEDGVDYIVEAMPDGIIKLPAKYFLNSKNGEKLIGAKIPKNLSEVQRLKVVELAKQLADSNLSYDFDFKKQKGPNSGEWICVGLTEKIYESANISNPLDLRGLEYDPQKYAVDITPDGFDDYSIIDTDSGDCLSRNREFSKISADRRTILPLPEVFGFNAGREYNGERYFFFPLTQYFQESLENVSVDIQLESDFIDNNVRGKVPEIAMIFRWSLVNNPVSALKGMANKIVSIFSGDKNSSKNKLTDSDIHSSVDNNIEKEEEDVGEDDSLLVNNSSEDIVAVVSNANTESASQITLGKVQSTISIEDGPGLNISAENLSSSNQPDDFASIELNNLTNTSTEIIEEEAEDVKEEPEIIENELDIMLGLAQNLLISKIYATLSDDYIEIYNPTNKTIDLEEAGVRLYKVKTSATPSLIMRLGNLSDGSYPGGVKISPSGRYLIARVNASEEIKSQAQAIATKSDFTFAGNGYTIYLSTGVVSSDIDEDIVDKVGFGKAKYFRQKSAPEILDNHILVRKAKNNSTAISMKTGESDYLLGHSYNSKNNFSDFVLVSLIENNNNESNSNNTNNNSSSSSTSNNSNSSNSSNTSNDSSSNSNSDDDSSDDENNTNDQIASTTEEIKPLLISKIYTTGSDSYVEIYNPNNQEINLEEAGIRLYRAKTSATPSIMMRIGNLSDGSYPGGVSVSPFGKYLITRSLASDETKSMAQAISTRSEFNFPLGGYTVYLADGAVSSDTDEDIIDKVGFGDAVYYCAFPAPEILENNILVRKATSTSTARDMSVYGNHHSLGNNYDTKNNFSDFVLVDLNFDYSQAEETEGGDDDEENENTEGDEDGDDNEQGEEDHNPEGEDNDGVIDPVYPDNNEPGDNNPEEPDPEDPDPEDPDPSDDSEESDSSNEDDDESNNENGGVADYCLAPGLYLDNIIHLWHADECQGSNTLDYISGELSEINFSWQEGKFACSFRQYYANGYLTKTLDESFSSNNFTLSFYYNNLNINSRPEMKFSNSISGDFFRIRLYPTNTDFYNTPGAYLKDYALVWPSDGQWHFFTWVVNKPENYWVLYRDGVEVYRKNMESSLFIEVDEFRIKGDNNYNLMDEIAIFNRALSPTEIADIYDTDLPLNHINCQASLVD